MSYAVSSIRTILVIAILASLAVSMTAMVQDATPVNETTNPEGAAAQSDINTSTWRTLKMIGIVMMVIIISVVLKYLQVI